MASFARAARSAWAQASRGIAQAGGVEGQAARTAVAQQCSRQSRGFASGGHGGDHGVTHAGVTLHKAAKWHSVTGQAFAGLMWFWIFYRFYNDYDTFIFGHAQHHEHTMHAADHGDEHGKKH